MDELERLYRRVVQNIRSGFPELLTRSFEVSQLYQQIVPYRTNRRELNFDSNEDYELALMQLLAGLRGYLVGDAEMQKAMRHELASPNPDLSAFRVYATATVTLAPDPLRALERNPVVQEAPRATSSPSPAEHVALAGRATEAVDVSASGPAIPRSAAPVPSRPAPAPVAAPAAPPVAAPVAAAPAAAAPAAAAPAAATVAAHVPPPRPPAPSAPAAPPRAPSAPASASVAPPPSSTAPAPPAAFRLEVPKPSADASMTAPRPAAPLAVAGASCRYCGCGLPEGRRVTFCPGCGHNLTVQHCPACATELEVGWKFCITCGRGVGQA